jgi:hypothetical protein
MGRRGSRPYHEKRTAKRSYIVAAPLMASFFDRTPLDNGRPRPLSIAVRGRPRPCHIFGL